MPNANARVIFHGWQFQRFRDFWFDDAGSAMLVRRCWFGDAGSTLQSKNARQNRNKSEYR
jgi:hypothetical protein